MNMLESCARFRTESREVLAETLTRMVTDLRRVLVHPDLQLDAKLTEVFRIVDAAAPPPGPGFPFPAGRPGTSGAGEGRAPGAGAAVTRSPAPS